MHASRFAIARAALFLALAMNFGSDAWAAAFPTNVWRGSVATTRRTGDWNDFRLKWFGYEDQLLNPAFDITLTGFNVGFRVTGIRDQAVYVDKLAADVTVSGSSNVWLVIAHTNVPPSATYHAEFWTYDDANTSTVRVLAQGTVQVLKSLYDGTNAAYFPYPTNNVDMTLYATSARLNNGVTAGSNYAAQVAGAAASASSNYAASLVGSWDNVSNVVIQSNATLGASIGTLSGSNAAHGVSIAALAASNTTQEAAIAANSASNSANGVSIAAVSAQAALWPATSNNIPAETINASGAIYRGPNMVRPSLWNPAAWADTGVLNASELASNDFVAATGCTYELTFDYVVSSGVKTFTASIGGSNETTSLSGTGTYTTRMVTVSTEGLVLSRPAVAGSITFSAITVRMLSGRLLIGNQDLDTRYLPIWFGGSATNGETLAQSAVSSNAVLNNSIATLSASNSAIGVSFATLAASNTAQGVSMATLSASNSQNGVSIAAKMGAFTNGTTGWRDGVLNGTNGVFFTLPPSSNFWILAP